MSSRQISHARVEVKALGDPTRGIFAGNLSTYGNIDFAGDIVEAGAYDATIQAKGTKRPLLWQHDPGEPIGSLEIVSTDEALRIEGHINRGTRRGEEAYSLLKAGDIDGLSIGYTVDDCHYDEDGVRHLDAVNLLEGSVVTFPADDLARVDDVKSDRTGGAGDGDGGKPEPDADDQAGKGGDPEAGADGGDGTDDEDDRAELEELGRAVHDAVQALLERLGSKKKE